jgi:hypothetical protein
MATEKQSPKRVRVAVAGEGDFAPDAVAHMTEQDWWETLVEYQPPGWAESLDKKASIKAGYDVLAHTSDWSPELVEWVNYCLQMQKYGIWDEVDSDRDEQSPTIWALEQWALRHLCIECGDEMAVYDPVEEYEEFGEIWGLGGKPGQCPWLCPECVPCLCDCPCAKCRRDS